MIVYNNKQYVYTVQLCPRIDDASFISQFVVNVFMCGHNMLHVKNT